TRASATSTASARSVRRISAPGSSSPIRPSQRTECPRRERPIATFDSAPATDRFAAVLVASGPVVLTAMSDSPKVRKSAGGVSVGRAVVIILRIRVSSDVGQLVSALATRAGGVHDRRVRGWYVRVHVTPSGRFVAVHDGDPWTRVDVTGEVAVERYVKVARTSVDFQSLHTTQVCCITRSEIRLANWALSTP